MNAIEDTPSARGWAEIARAFPKPNAIVVISAHWVTDGVRVTSNAHPRTIHDFGRSFPQALFDVQYPAPGDLDLARAIVEKLTAFGAQLDDTWGLDHGTWSVVKHMYPDADVPIVQVSLDIRRPPAEHYEIASALAPLRDDNILLIGSGNIVHNLPAFFRNQGEATPWDNEFDDYIVDAVNRRDHDAVLNYASHPTIPRANADWEHFFPLFYALGRAARGRDATLLQPPLLPGHFHDFDRLWSAAMKDGLTHIRIRGAREHNLKGVNVDIPRNELVVITGLSGSGKSSLAFDTIYAEGQRRYVESLSAYARQFLELMQKPDVDSIEGPLAGDLDRAEDHLAQSALDRRHRHRNLRLHAPALGARRHSVFARHRPADRGDASQRNGRPHHGAARRHAALFARARSRATARANTGRKWRSC